ncbi:small ribosomal subunit protein mL104 (rPPR9)-like [Rosa rugosa]|uniref:small ribosomal subunit protein mL104 (rPPR9)-like n=1 Tax=Rosa rugosa TaxID=74645 RepID=UPI002B416171|nr:small ribosomal subunit protein mL104 (rPPR9)-like [Rosa rugosa]
MVINIYKMLNLRKEFSAQLWYRFLLPLGLLVETVSSEKMVKGLVNEFFPDEYVCDLLIKGWYVDGKLEEARRLAGEMCRGGFEIGTSAFNAILDCVCKLCRKKDPFRLHFEAEQILVDMEFHGVPRNVETFNVLITNLCKIRKTEDALNLFHRMGEWGCSPNETTFLET